MVEQSLLSRLQKIQALAERAGTVEEAAVAMAKLQALLEKHNLAVHDIHTGTERAESYIGEGYQLGGQATWRRQLIGVIATHYFCFAPYYPGSDWVTIVGEPHNVQAVRFSYELISTQLDRLCEKTWQELRRRRDFHQTLQQKLEQEQKHLEPFSDAWLKLGHRLIENTAKAQLPNARRWKNSFYLGAATEINRRLTEQRQRFTADATGRALVADKDDELRRAIRRLIGRTRSDNSRSSIDRDGYERGRKAGRQVGMDDQLSGGVRALRGGN